MTTPTKTKAEVRERLTAAEAQARGLIPVGWAWSEEEQKPVAASLAELERPFLERPVDLEQQLAAFKRNRDTLVRFVQTYLEEASYDAKGYPVPGQVRDYYKVPGAQTKALTKRGGEKLAQLFRFGKASTTIVAHTETKEYVSATVEVTLADQYRRPVGSAVSSCSTAEGGFTSERAKKKYNNDYRAALNDVVARAAKRAFVQAVIVAAAADEMFTGTAVDEGAPGGEQTPPPEKPRFPANWGKVSSKLVEEVETDRLIKIGKWCRESGVSGPAVAPLIQAIDEELEKRRMDVSGGPPDE